MKEIETITIEAAMHSRPWKEHELNEAVRVEMDYGSLQWFCRLLDLVTKAVAQQVEYALIYGTEKDEEQKKAINGVTTREAIYILQLDRIERELLKKCDRRYFLAIERAIEALQAAEWMRDMIKDATKPTTN